jgi:nitroreductase
MHPVLQALHALRSTHGTFDEREVCADDLQAILEASVRAANASARQAYSIILLEDRDRMERLLGYRASRALVYCVDSHRLDLLAARRGRVHDAAEINEFVNGIVEVSLAAQNAVVAARALGIDSLVTNALHRKPFDLVYRELALPERSVFPVITVLLGHAADRSPARRRGRLPLEHVVHRDRYREPSPEELDRIAAAYDDRDAAIGLVELWDAKVYPHYLDWYFERWVEKSPDVRVEQGWRKDYQDRIRKSGFWWPTGPGELGGRAEP